MKNVFSGLRWRRAWPVLIVAALALVLSGCSPALIVINAQSGSPDNFLGLTAQCNTPTTAPNNRPAYACIASGGGALNGTSFRILQVLGGSSTPNNVDCVANPCPEGGHSILIALLQYRTPSGATVNTSAEIVVSDPDPSIADTVSIQITGIGSHTYTCNNCLEVALTAGSLGAPGIGGQSVARGMGDRPNHMSFAISAGKH